MTASSHLTIRNVPADLARALHAEARRRRTSLNSTAKDILSRALGVHPETGYDNGLSRLAGTWNEEQLQEFERATACFEAVDDEVWSEGERGPGRPGSRARVTRRPRR